MSKSTKQPRRGEELRLCVKTMRSFLLHYRGRLEADLRAEGFSLPQLRLLYAISKFKDAPGAELARVCEVTPQSMQTLLVRAQREGWIERQHSSKNGRILTASLTVKGEEVLERGDRAARKIEQDLWEGVETGEVQEMRMLLETILTRCEDGAEQ